MAVLDLETLGNFLRICSYAARKDYKTSLAQVQIVQIGSDSYRLVGITKRGKTVASVLHPEECKTDLAAADYLRGVLDCLEVTARLIDSTLPPDDDPVYQPPPEIRHMFQKVRESK